MTCYSKTRWVASTAGAFLFAACAVGPDYVRPVLSPPANWAQEANSSDGDLLEWWKQFDDEHLTDLIQRSTAGNLDLRVAFERIAEARELLRVTSVRRYPSVDVSESATRSDLSSATTGMNSRPVWVYDIGLSVGWEIDVFGRVQRSIEAATADFETFVEDYRSVMTSVHAAVASAYVDVRLAQRRLTIASANLAVQQGSLKYATDRRDAGQVSGLDVAQAESNIATTEATIPTLEVDLDRSIYRLAVLLGSPIADLRDELLAVKPIPIGPTQVSSGLPANLLRNRPDLRAAERSLAAETARIGVAAADLYPSFNFSAALGGQALQVNDLFDGGARRWSLGVSGFNTLFNFGGVQANVDAQRARMRAALATYEQTLLLSVEEVETAITSLRRERTRAAALGRAVVANELSVELSEQLYRSGQVDFQNLRDTQRGLLELQDQLAASEAAIAQNTISLFLALGGSWDPEEDVLTPREESNS